MELIIKSMKRMEPSGEYSELIPIGADAIHVYMSDGKTLEAQMKETNSNLNDNYYDKTTIDEKIANLWDVIIVDELPKENISKTSFYWKRKHPGDPTSGYDIYVWYQEDWLMVGDTLTDLSDYYTKSETDNEIKKVGVNTYSGTTTPDNSLGKNGDLYILLES